MGYEVRIQRMEPSAFVDLQGNAASIVDWVGDALPPLPDHPNTASLENGLALYWLAPERWLVRADLDREDELLEATNPAEAPTEISVVQVSDTLQVFSITGPEAGEIISIASPLDHHSSVFPHNGVTYTDIFGIKGLVIRRQDGFEIAVERSYGDMIEDYLTRANA